MSTRDIEQRRTLAAWVVDASHMQAADWGDLGADQVALTPTERERVAATWLWLCGVSPDSDDAARVRREVLSDGPLTVALALPAVEFMRWFRAQHWEDFDSTERTGGEAWAMTALQRAWGACEGLGLLAVQVSLTECAQVRSSQRA